jgi:hypothetical protein
MWDNVAGIWVNPLKHSELVLISKDPAFLPQVLLNLQVFMVLKKGAISLNNINFKMETHCVFCEIGN